MSHGHLPDESLFWEFCGLWQVMKLCHLAPQTHDDKNAVWQGEQCELDSKLVFGNGFNDPVMASSLSSLAFFGFLDFLVSPLMIDTATKIHVA